jgi:hypothetical protein
VSYIILISRLKASRIERVIVDMLETFLHSESEEPNTVIAQNSLPDIGVITELFDQLGLTNVVYPVSEDYPAEQRQKDGVDRHRYNITLSPAGSCSMLDCPICCGEIQVGPPRIFILGLPLEHPALIEANKRYQSWRKGRLKIMKATMTAFAMTDNLL